jgi:hypothetical protein
MPLSLLIAESEFGVCARALPSRRLVGWALVVGVAACLTSGAPICAQDNQSSAKPNRNDVRGPIDVLSDTKGIALNFVTAALARLQLGRAYAMAGDSAKAKSAYQDFLTLWKDADPDIPILKEAKAEYAKLQ